MEKENKKTFLNELHKLIYRDNKFYKVWRFLTSGMFHFVKNVWYFRKELYEYQKWDWLYQISLLRKGLELHSDYLTEHGHDDDKIKFKKINKIDRVVYILKCHENDTFIELAEMELGYEYKHDFCELGNNKLSYLEKEQNAAIYKKSLEIEDILWCEFLEIIDGQDLSSVRSELEWERKFDGSGIKGWID